MEDDDDDGAVPVGVVESRKFLTATLLAMTEDDFLRVSRKQLRQLLEDHCGYEKDALKKHRRSMRAFMTDIYDEVEQLRQTMSTYYRHSL